MPKLRIRKSNDGLGNIKEINCYFFRHGFSCANAQQKFSKQLGRNNIILSIFKRDPPLTCLGKQLTQHTSTLLSDI